MARLTPGGGYTTPIALPAGSGPRRIAAGADNTLWVTLETSKQIARITGVDPAAGHAACLHAIPRTAFKLLSEPPRG